MYVFTIKIVLLKGDKQDISRKTRRIGWLSEKMHETHGTSKIPYECNIKKFERV